MPFLAKNKLTSAILISLLAVLTLLFLRNVLFLKGDYIIQGGDLVQTYYQKFIYKEALLRLRLPLWNPCIYSGYPYLAHPYNGVFYPINLLFLIIPINVAYSWILALHVFLSGIFMFILVKYLTKNYWASLISALAFMFSGFTGNRIWAGHFELFTTSIWIPLIFLLFAKTLDKKSVGYAIATAMALAIQFFSGHNQTSFFTILILLVYFIFTYLGNLSAFSKSLSARQNLLRGIFLFGAVILFFAILSAVQLLPTLELTRLSTRGQGIPFFKSAYGSFPPEHLVRFLFPDFFGNFLKTFNYGDPVLGEVYWEFTYYIGIVPFLLAAYAVFKLINKRSKRILLILAITGIILSGVTRLVFLQLWQIRNHPASGNPWTVSMVNFFEALYNGSRPMGWVLMFFFLFLAIVLLILKFLKRKFVDAVEEKKNNEKMALFFIILFCVGIVLAFGHYASGLYYFLYKFFPGYNSFKWPSRHLIISNFALCILAGYGICQIKKQYYLKTAIIFLTLFDLFLYGNRFIYLKNLEEFSPPQKVIDEIRNSGGIQRIITFPIAKSGCVFEPSCSQFQSNAAVGYGIYNITGYDPIILKRYHQFTNLMQGIARDDFGDVTIRVNNLENENFLKLLGVEYVFADQNLERYQLNKKRVQLLEAGNSGCLYTLKNIFPRFWFVAQALIANNDNELEKSITDPSFSPEKKVVLESRDAPEPLGESFQEGYDLKLVRYSHSAIDLDIVVNGRGYLVASEIYYPGWKALVNGNEAKIYRSNYAFRSIFIPAAGKYTVQFRFEPDSLKIGKLITVFGIVLAFLYFLVYFVKINKLKPKRK